MLIRFFLLLVLASPVFAADEPGNIWTTVNDTDPAATYSPGMESRGFGGYYHTDMHVSQKPGEWAEFSFVGSGVKWIGAKNVDHGDADVYIDGKLEITVRSVAPTWLMQQELYTKTGLPLGSHTLKIVTKSTNYVDFDAFAFYGPAPRAATMPKIEGVLLPPTQPLLNVASRYPIGNGVAVAICDPQGRIETVFGPGYTTSDLTQHEDLQVDLDNDELPLRVDMKRAAKTGVFYGVASRGDIDIGVVDFACPGQPWISRLIVLKNTSKTASHNVVVRDIIAPRTDNGYTYGAVADATGKHAGFKIQADTSIGVPFGGNNPVNKTVIIAFNDPSSSADANGSDASVQTKPIHLAPNAQDEVALTHYFFAGEDVTPAAAITAIRGFDNHANLQKSIDAWRKWIEGVAPAYALSKITDPRGRTLMEGALAVLKTNQSQDGGVVAHTTFYKENYIRDAAMAIRGLLAAGHPEEAKQWLVWCDKKLSIHNHFGDAMNCDVSLDVKSSTFDMGDMEVEEPGWVLLVARDYYEQTHDLAFLKSIDRTLAYCADVQLREAEANNYKLSFNGDETEICGAVDTHATGTPGGGDAAKADYSLSSVAMAAASVAFYADYVKAAGGDPANYKNAKTNTTVDLNGEVKKLVAAMDRDFWRTDVAGASAGFHDFFRAKADGAWPKARDVNFTLMPLFFSTPYSVDEKVKDAAAMGDLFDTKTGFLQLVPSEKNGMEGQDLGYLLWGLVEAGDWRKELVYSALVNGPTVDAWGAFSEAYSSDGHPNNHDLRSLETGVDVSGLAKYWGLGK